MTSKKAPAKKVAAPAKAKPKVEQRIGKVTRAFLGFEDHGFLTATLSFDYGGASQSIPPRIFGTREQGYSDALSKFVAAVLDVFSVPDWSMLVGRTCFVIITDSLISGLAPLPTEVGKAVDLGELFPASAP